MDAKFEIVIFFFVCLTQLCTESFQYDPETSPENIRYRGPPQVMLAYLEYQHSLGDDVKRKEAFARLQVQHISPFFPLMITAFCYHYLLGGLLTTYFSWHKIIALGFGYRDFKCPKQSTCYPSWLWKLYKFKCSTPCPCIS